MREHKTRRPLNKMSTAWLRDERPSARAQNIRHTSDEKRKDKELGARAKGLRPRNLEPSTSLALFALHAFCGDSQTYASKRTSKIFAAKYMRSHV